MGQHAAVQALAHQLMGDVQALAQQLTLTCEVLTSPQEQLLLDRARGRLAALPDARWTEVPGVGHALAVDAPEAVVAGLLRLLGEAG